MGYSVGVIEAVPGQVPVKLLAAFAALEASVRIFSMAELAISARNPQVDVFVVAAEVPAGELAGLMVRFTDADPAPVVLIFAESQFEQLEQHIRHGRDYIVPPFLPSLLRVRMQTCYERAQLSHSVAEAQERARLVASDREMEIGRQIQVGFRPPTLPQPAGGALEARFQPARKVSGDFYDAFQVANGRRIAFIVADVCDKGVGAALFMALIRSLLRHTAESSGLQSLAAERSVASADAADVVPVVGATPMMNAIRSTNDYLTRNHGEQGYFATLFFGVLDPGTGRITYVNCGHNPPILLRSAGLADGLGSVMLEHTGPAVGVIPDCAYALGQVRVAPGETLFLYTDGVTEARSVTGEFFGEPRLQQSVCAAEASGSGMLNRVKRAVDTHIGAADQFDDITMMTIRRLAEPGRPTIAG